MMLLMTLSIIVLAVLALITSLVAIDVSFKTNTPQQCPRLAAGLSMAFLIMAFDALIHPGQIEMTTVKHVVWYFMIAGSLVMIMLYNRAQVMRTRLMINLVKKRKARANRINTQASDACV